jgi:RNase P subunit RPR2
MKCKNCNTEFDIDNVRTTIAAHDDDKLDIIVECHVCGRKLNEFISITEMVVIEDGKASQEAETC